MIKLYSILNAIKSFLIDYKYFILIGITLLVIIVLFSIKKIRSKIYEYMTSAETGALTSEGLHTVIDKIQQSDWDDRMVLVVAKLITSFPILKLLPTKLVAKWLNKMVQASFDKIKGLLKARSEKILSEVYNNEELNNKKLEIEKKVLDAETYIRDIVDNVKNELIGNMGVDEVTATLKIVDAIDKVNTTKETIEDAVENVSEVIDKITPKLDDLSSLFNNE